MDKVKSEDTAGYYKKESSVFGYTENYSLTDDQIIEKAITILEERLKLTENLNLTSVDAAKKFVFSNISNKEREVFSVLFLNNQHKLIKYEELFYGTIDTASVYPREIVKRALELNSAAIIVAHNHPSGISEPSQSDEIITDRINNACRLLEIRLLDHLIIGNEFNKITSLAERGIV